ncbi:MAG: hypothetical protein IJW86_02835 [Clostridia bacterium]|nr:hypothetical protein [Clostridia bacterium]
MVNKKEISDVLSLYETEQYSKEAKDNLKAQVSAISIRHVPEFSLAGFLSGVIKGLTPWFFVLSLGYLVVVFIITSNSQSAASPLIACIMTPLLAVGSVGCIYFSSSPQFLEMESACLYKPETVFAGRLVLCGIYDLAVVCIGSLMSETFLYTISLSLIGFLLSSIAVLSMCCIFNVKAVIGLSAGMVFVFAGFVVSQSEVTTRIQSVLWALPIGSIAVTLFVLILSALFIGLIAIKNFNFERLVKMYED